MSQPIAPRRSLAIVAVTIIGAGSLLGACSSENPCGDIIETRADDDADFGSYETFAVLEVPDEGGSAGAGGEGSGIPDDIRLNLEAANTAAANELESIGLTEVGVDDDPDLFVVSASASREETELTWYCVPGWYWWGWYYYWDPCAWMVPIEIEYTEGSLLVALVDAATEAPVFGGVVQGILECTDDDLQSRIEEGVEEIFEDYPSE